MISISDSTCSISASSHFYAVAVEKAALEKDEILF